MHKLPPLIVAFIVLCSFGVKGGVAVSPVRVDVAKRDSALNVAYTLQQIATMKPSEVEKIFGTKMTLKEKLAFKVAQSRLKKALKAKEEEKSSEGQTAFILALIGICVLFIPYANIASIPLAIMGIVKGAHAKKVNKNDTKAQTAIVLGIVTLGLIALGIILLIIWLSSWGWGWG